MYNIYITGKLKSDEVTHMVYTPTEETISNYLTKALQGKLYIKHYSRLMGLNGFDEW